MNGEALCSTGILLFSVFLPPVRAWHKYDLRRDVLDHLMFKEKFTTYDMRYIKCNVMIVLIITLIHDFLAFSSASRSTSNHHSNSLDGGKHVPRGS